MFELNLSFLTSALATCLALIFSYYTLQIYNLRKKYNHIPGPPADGIFGFYLGNSIELAVHRKINNKLMSDLFLEWFLKNFFFF
jgi:hypothetical protein